MNQLIATKTLTVGQGDENEILTSPAWSVHMHYENLMMSFNANVMKHYFELEINGNFFSQLNHESNLNCLTVMEREPLVLLQLTCNIKCTLEEVQFRLMEMLLHDVSELFHNIP